MRVLFLSDDFPPQSFGGAGISTYELALGMKKMSHEVFVVTTCRKEIEAGESDYNGIKIWRIASNYSGRWRAYVSLYNWSVARKLEGLLQKIKPDVVHVNNVHFYLSYYSIKVARRYAQVVVWTARDVMAFNYGKLMTRRYLENFDGHTTWLDHLKQARKRWNPFRNFFIRKYLGYADKLFAVSNALKKALGQNGIQNVEVMHTGVDVDSWRKDEAEAIQFREKYNLKNKKVILFGGRLSEAKGGRKALETMPKIIKAMPNTVLLVVGQIDDYAEYLNREAKKLGIGDKLIFTGWVERDQIRHVYACADLVLVPSICFDAFPRIVLEAMAMGRPVVGTCYGGAPEIIVDGVTGYVVNPFNIQEMAGKIIDLLKDPEKAKRFGKAGYDRVKTDFNLDDKVSKLISYYQELLA